MSHFHAQHCRCAGSSHATILRRFEDGRTLPLSCSTPNKFPSLPTTPRRNAAESVLFRYKSVLVFVSSPLFVFLTCLTLCASQWHVLPHHHAQSNSASGAIALPYLPLCTDGSSRPAAKAPCPQCGSHAAQKLHVFLNGLRSVYVEPANLLRVIEPRSCCCFASTASRRIRQS